MTPCNLSFLMMLLLALTSCSPGGAEMSASNAQDMGMMSGETPEEMGAGMMGRMMSGDHPMADMATIRDLLVSHDRIERRVENVPGGVRTVTVSDDPHIAQSIRRHVREMRDRYDRGQPIYDLRITHALILQPRVEIDLSAQDVPELGLGAGLSHAAAGVRLRYEVEPEFAPYLGLEYERAFGDTADFARASGEEAGGWAFLLGVRAWF